MPKYDIQAIRAAMRRAIPEIPMRQFDGKNSIIERAEVDAKPDVDKPGSPVIFNMMLWPRKDFTLWPFPLEANYDANQQRIAVWPYVSDDEYSGDATLGELELLQRDNLMEFLDLIRLSAEDLKIVDDAVKAYVMGDTA